MQKGLKAGDKNIEKTIRDILKSRSRSSVYLYLLKKEGAKTEQVIKGTCLHPSTVRETLSKMHDQKLIYRKKIKNDSIGKNPYLYYAIPPVKLLRKYVREMENRLNKLASLAMPREQRRNFRPIRIEICEGADKI